MKKILLIGEPMGLFIANDYGELDKVKDFSLKVAGAELNVAIGLKRLGYDVEYVTKLGYDPLSKMIYDFIKKNNIGTKYISFTADHSAGMMLKNKIIDGDPKIAYYRKNSAASTLSISDVENIDVSDFDLLHVTGITLCISSTLKDATIYLVDKFKKNSKPVTLDPNIRLNMWESKEKMRIILNELSRKANLILAGISEAEMLLETNDIDKIIKKYEDMNIHNFIIKDGSKGAYYIKSNEKYFSKAFKVENVVDTVGAGDGFAVGVISGYLENLQPDLILERGNAIGSIQVQNISDNEGLPTRKELEIYIEKNKDKRYEGEI